MCHATHVTHITHAVHAASIAAGSTMQRARNVSITTVITLSCAVVLGLIGLVMMATRDRWFLATTTTRGTVASGYKWTSSKTYFRTGMLGHHKMKTKCHTACFTLSSLLLYIVVIFHTAHPWRCATSLLLGIRFHCKKYNQMISLFNRLLPVCVAVIKCTHHYTVHAKWYRRVKVNFVLSPS